MKKARLLICVGFFFLWMVCFPGRTLAQTELSAQVAALVQAAFPSHRVLLSDQCGRTAAAVVSDGQTQILCLAEQQNGDWTLTLSSSTALDQNASLFGLMLDTDESLCWTYRLDDTVTETYYALRAEDQWRVTGLVIKDGKEESALQYSQGTLQYSTHARDQSHRTLSASTYMPVPASWLEKLLPLDVYAHGSFPEPNRMYTHSWLSEEVTALAAAELFPNATFLGGCAGEDDLQFFLEMPGGERVIASCWLNRENAWNIVCSSPLPEGAAYGHQNFSTSVAIGDLLVNVGPVDETTCGVTYVYSMGSDGAGSCMLHFGKNWLTGSVPNGYENSFGDHPWSDITAIDWNSLPHTLEEAMAALDSSNWAIVNNPDPAGLLPLQTSPEDEASALGAYYNGTPARVLSQKENWAQVDIFGAQGWMRKDCLAFGDAGHEVQAMFPLRLPAKTQDDHWVYAEPETGRPITKDPRTEELLVLGVAGDAWYHAWFPGDRLTGYVPQSDWEE